MENIDKTEFAKMEIYARMGLVFADMAETCAFNALHLADKDNMDGEVKMKCAANMYQAGEVKKKFAAAEKEAKEYLAYIYSGEKGSTTDTIIGNSDFLYEAVFLMMEKTDPDEKGEQRMLDTLRKLPNRRGYLKRILGDVVIKK